jgi:IS5 family transposase
VVDATIVLVPKQRNTREENEAVKVGKTPNAWRQNPAKNRQKDKDARWTKKHGKSFFGYKNHVNADARHKLIRQYEVTDGSVHYSQKFDGLVNQSNTARDVYADSAYRSAETERKLQARGLRSRVHQRASRGHALSKAEENANRQKSKVRVVSSMYSGRSKILSAVGWYGRSASCGRKPRSVSKTSPTISAAL